MLFVLLSYLWNNIITFFGNRYNNENLIHIYSFAARKRGRVPALLVEECVTVFAGIPAAKVNSATYFFAVPIGSSFPNLATSSDIVPKRATFEKIA